MKINRNNEIPINHIHAHKWFQLIEKALFTKELTGMSLPIKLKLLYDVTNLPNIILFLLKVSLFTNPRLYRDNTFSFHNSNTFFQIDISLMLNSILQT